MGGADTKSDEQESGRDHRPSQGAAEGERAPVSSETGTSVQEQASAHEEPPASAKPTKGTNNGRRPRRFLGWLMGKQETDTSEVTAIPPIEPPNVAIFVAELNPGRAFARILFNEKKSSYLYEALEPILTATQQEALKFVSDVLVRTLEVDLDLLGREPTPESVAYLHRRIDEIARDYRVNVSSSGLKRLHYYMERDFIGFGPIDVPMRDPDIEDISCDGPSAPLFLYHRKFGSVATNIRFQGTADLDGFVIRMAQRSGKQITIANPLLDGALPEGSRLQATLGKEVTDNGSTFTIRRFKANPLSPIELVKLGTMSPELLAYFWILVEYGASLIFAGGTASGKTTSLNAISLFIPPNVKIVSIEDTREINLPHPNWVRSVTRGSARDVQGRNIDMYDLLTAAMRQRPEYILVGEVRGKEATVAFQAMATGHTVYATMHADSARSVVYRLENEPINIPRIVLQALDVIALQTLASYGGRRVRRIREVAEIVGIDPTTKEFLTHNPFTWNSTTDTFHYTGRSYKLARIAERNNWSEERLELELARRARIVKGLVGRGSLTYEQIAHIVAAYTRQPEETEAELATPAPRTATGDAV